MRSLVFSALALAGGCDPGEFAAALDKAPVQVIGAPGGLGSSAGVTLLPLAPDPNTPARLLFAGTHVPSLAVADFDRDGKPQVRAATGEELGKLGLASSQDPGQNGISSAAWLSGWSAAGTIALGMPNFVSSPGQGTLALLGVDASGNPDFKSPVQAPRRHGLDTEHHFGLAVAAGRVTQAAADEAIVVSDEGVHVLGFLTGDVLSAASCAVSMPMPPDLHRSLAVGNFLLGGNDEIAVGLPVASGAGRVVILQYLSGAAGLSCPIELPVPGGNPPGFGTALATVPDMNGDGLAELVVGAPPDGAYLFVSPFYGNTVSKTFIKSDPLYEFGRRVALVDIDADGSKELAITAVQVSGQNAEQVLVYELNGDPVAIVNDSALTVTPSTDFGLAELEFDNRSPICPKGRDTHLLVAGADTGIFTFFHFAGTADPTTALAPDPRCFAQK